MSEPSTSAGNPEEKPKQEEVEDSGAKALREALKSQGFATPREGVPQPVRVEPLKLKVVKPKPVGTAPKPQKEPKLSVKLEGIKVKLEPEEGGSQEKPAKKATKRKRPSTEAEEGKTTDEANEERKKRRRERSQAASIVCQYQHPNAEAVMVQCKQRAILGFRFCIRHILQDSEAPYQQCAHQRRPKNKNDMVTRCTNAIRKDSNETFCSTHLIMQGLKEAKKKPHTGTEETSGRSTPHDGADVASPGQIPLHGSSTTSPTEVLSPICHDGDMPRALPIVKREPVECVPLRALPIVKREPMEPGPSPMPPLSVATMKNENSHLMRALSSPGGFPHQMPPQMSQAHQMPPRQMIPPQHLAPGAPRPPGPILVGQKPPGPMSSGQMPPGVSTAGQMPPGATMPGQMPSRAVPGQMLPGQMPPRQGLPPGVPMQRILLEPKLEPREYSGPQAPLQHPPPHHPQMRMPPMHSVPSTSAGFIRQQDYNMMPQQPPQMPQQPLQMPQQPLQAMPQQQPQMPPHSMPQQLPQSSMPQQPPQALQQQPLQSPIPQQPPQSPMIQQPPQVPVPQQQQPQVSMPQQRQQPQPPMPQQSQPPMPQQPPQPPVGKLSCSELLLRMTPAQRAVFEKFSHARAQHTAQAPARAERAAMLQRIVPQKVGGRPRKLNPEHVTRIDRILNKISPQARQLWALSLTSRTGQRMMTQQIPFSVAAVEKVNLQMAKRIYHLARKRVPRVGVRSNTLFDNSKLPTAAPPIRPPSPSSDEDNNEMDGGQPRVIKLRHKRQVRKMVGPYRDVAVVSQMCDKLEDADFEETDLFPLGLEPSDDEYDGLSSSLSVIHPTGMTLMADYKEPSSELYLLRKQLRLERHQLLKTAQLNASIMKSAKLFPVSTGAALRQRGDATPLPPQLLINTLKRCCQIESKQRCQRSCQPNSNHCNVHALYNVHQKIYEFCKQPGCRRPVLCVDSHLWDGLCRLHRESRLDKYGEYPIYADTELPQARAYSRLSSKSDTEEDSDSEMEEDGDAPRGDDFDEMEDDDEGSIGTP